MPSFIGFPELLVLGLVLLLVFGPRRLPEMGRSLGRGLREFKTRSPAAQSSSNPRRRASARARQLRVSRGVRSLETRWNMVTSAPD